MLMFLFDKWDFFKLYKGIALAAGILRLEFLVIY